MMSEEHDGPTPNGGVKSVAYYLDEDDQPAEKGEATHVKIEEIDEQGSIIKRTYGSLNRE